jgi:predicted permease
MRGNVLSGFRSAWRQLLRHPWFSVIAVLSLGLGIGANALLFTAVNDVLLKAPRGVSDPAMLVDIGRSERGEGFDTVTWGDLQGMRESVPSLASVYGYTMKPLNLLAGDEPVRTLGLVTSEGYFDTLGVQAALGRVFSGPDSAPGSNPVVVASHAAWQRWLDADPNAIGRSVDLNGHRFTLIGVLPRDFRGPFAVIAPDFFVPAAMIAALQANAENLLDGYRAHWLLAAGRLAPGASIETLRAELDVFAARVRTAHPEYEHRGYAAAPMRGMPANGISDSGPFIALLFALAGLVLLVACVNVAGMLIAQGERRASEIGMRYALGASRVRVIRDLLAESLLLAFLAGLVGFISAFQAENLLEAIPLPTPLPLALDVAPDFRVIAFLFAVSCATVLLFGLLPAWRTSTVDPQRAITGASSAPVRTRLRETLAAAQIAITLVLIITTLLMGRALLRAQGLETGYRTEGVLVAELDLEPSGRNDRDAANLAARILQHARELPGVRAAALGAMQPLTLSSMGMGGVWAPGAGEEPTTWPNVDMVSPGYFATLGVDLRGRDFTSDDVAASEPVAIINQRLARALFGDDDPVGRSFDSEAFGERRSVRVIGITPDGKYASLGEEPRSFVYMTLSQLPRASLNLFLHTDRPAQELDQDLRAILRELDPNLPSGRVHRMQDLAAIGLLPQRIVGVVSGAMGSLGILLAATGIYGVIAFQVLRRTREFGVRLALGATAGTLMRSIFRSAMRIAIVGIMVGSVLAFGMSRALAGLLFGVDAGDVLAFGAGAILLFGVTLIATLSPALHAAGVEPSTALRHE